MCNVQICRECNKAFNNINELDEFINILELGVCIKCYKYETNMLKRAINIYEKLNVQLTNPDALDHPEDLVHWYDCYYLTSPDVYPNPILGL